ncbi:MAG: hypothetical protein RIE73_26605 [Coleofasciculus sp. C1-SOL-03]|uniref:hypothetical protein n=1 Tax=Coleofasciculus sp. C1-SOL-03 TaxID=3069522 RepID=UPI0032F8FDEA
MQYRRAIAFYSQIKLPRDRIPSIQPNYQANSLVAVKGEKRSLSHYLQKPQFYRGR